jgi:hypothetical protein
MMEESHTAAGYFIAIIAVVGATLLIPPFPVFFTIGTMLLLLLTPFLLIYGTRRGQDRHKAQQQKVMAQQVKERPALAEIEGTAVSPAMRAEEQTVETREAVPART